MLQVADDNALGQIEQDCFEPALLLLRALRSARNRLRRPGARRGELLRQLLDGTRKPLEGVAGRHQQPAILLGQGQRFRLAGQDLDRPHHPQVKNRPGCREQHQHAAEAHQHQRADARQVLLDRAPGLSERSQHHGRDQEARPGKRPEHERHEHIQAHRCAALASPLIHCGILRRDRAPSRPEPPPPWSRTAW